MRKGMRKRFVGPSVKPTQRVLYGEGVDKKKNGSSGILTHTNKEGIPVSFYCNDHNLFVSPKLFIIVLFQI